MMFIIQNITNNYRLLIFLTIFNFTLLLTSCSDDKSVDNSKDVIKIGALLPLTGSGSSTGESMLAAINYCVEHNNKILKNKPKIEMHIYDTQTNPQVALQKLSMLKDLGVTYIIGPYSSAELETIKDYANDNNLVLLSPSSVSISLAIENDNVFRLATNDFHQVAAISKYFEKQNLKKIIAVNRNDIWGNSLYDTVNDKSMSSDFKISNQIQYNTDLTDFTQISENIETSTNLLINNNSNHDEIVVFLACFNEGTDILSKSSGKENSEKINWLGTSAYALNSTILSNNLASDFAINTNLVCPVYAPDEDFNNVLAPVQNYLKTELGREPESYAYTAYDAVNIAYNAANQIRINSTTKPTDAVLQYCNSNSGITGPLELDKYGDRKVGNYNFWQIRKIQSENQWFIKYKYKVKTDELLEIQ